jgi:hypothetical protein
MPKSVLRAAFHFLQGVIRQMCSSADVRTSSLDHTHTFMRFRQWQEGATFTALSGIVHTGAISSACLMAQ